MIPAAAALLPAGFVRLIDDPATHLLAVIDEVLPEHDENEHSGDEQDAAPDEQAELQPLTRSRSPGRSRSGAGKVGRRGGHAGRC